MRVPDVFCLNRGELIVDLDQLEVMCVQIINQPSTWFTEHAKYIIIGQYHISITKD